MATAAGSWGKGSTPEGADDMNLDTTGGKTALWIRMKLATSTSMVSNHTPWILGVSLGSQGQLCERRGENRGLASRPLPGSPRVVLFPILGFTVSLFEKKRGGGLCLKDI